MGPKKRKLGGEKPLFKPRRTKIAFLLVDGLALDLIILRTERLPALR